jgi:hypothetical protein
MQPQFQSGLGSPCQQRSSGQVPVCCVTDLNGNILLRNFENASDTVRKWRIVRARTTTTRFWTASVAFVQVALDLPDVSADFPLLKPNPERIAAGWDGTGKAPVVQDSPLPLQYLDEIAIYMGYLDRLRPITADDIDQNRLLRVFIGVVDTITGAGTTNQGNNIAIQCRDRMKYLMDSLSSYNSGDATAFNVIKDLDEAQATGQSTNPEDRKLQATPNRSNVILNIARRAVGDLRTSFDPETGKGSTCGMACGIGIQGESEGAFVADIGVSSTQAYNPYAPYIPSSKINDKDVPFIGGRTENQPLTLGFPKFNILTGRTAYEGTAENFGNAQNFVVADRVPIEYIKYLAMQEPNPTEVFVDHQTGDYWYTPRGLDTTGLNDPKRLNRTYFYRQYPEGIIPDLAQMVTVCKEERSSVGWRSNIIATQTANNDVQNPITIHLRVVPDWLKGRAYPCSYYTVTDPTAKNVAELAAIALAFARIFAKETRALTIHTVGDPSLTPGEAIQVIGSPLNPDSLKSWAEERKTLLTYYEGYTQFSKELIEKIKTPPTNPSGGSAGDTPEVTYNTAAFAENATTKVSGAKTDGSSTARILCNKDGPSSTYGDSNVIKFKPEPQTMWRIENVVHRFGDPSGYITEIAALSPF